MGCSVSLLVGLGLVAGSACAGGATPSAGRTAAACPHAALAAGLPVWPRSGGVLHADVDGDGSRDAVSIRYARRAWASCGFFLVVSTGSHVHAERLPEWYQPPEHLLVGDWPFGAPSIVAVVRLAPKRLQVAVTRWYGASYSGVSLHGMVNGRLEQLGFRPALYRNELRLGSSAGTGGTTVRCRPGGPLMLLQISSGSLVHSTRSVIRRSDYRLGSKVLSRIRTVGTSGVGVHVDASAFSGCRVAGSGRVW